MRRTKDTNSQSVDCVGPNCNVSFKHHANRYIKGFFRCAQTCALLVWCHDGNSRESSSSIMRLGFWKLCNCAHSMYKPPCLGGNMNLVRWMQVVLCCFPLRVSKWKISLLLHKGRWSPTFGAGTQIASHPAARLSQGLKELFSLMSVVKHFPEQWELWMTLCSLQSAV